MSTNHAEIYRCADDLLRKGEAESTEKALAMLASITASEPANAKAWFELAGAYDFQGREAEALPFYYRAKEIGYQNLPEVDRPRLFVQLGSTLRNLKKYAESKAILLEGLEHFPHMAALRAILGLTSYSNGNYRHAARQFLQACIPEAGDTSLQDYARPLRFYESQIDVFPARQRNWMRIDLRDYESAKDNHPATAITLQHALALARLMKASYQGTIDYEGETLDECLEEMKGTISGKYGPFLAMGSFAAFEGEKAIAASMITLWKENPLVAFTMTDPEYKRKGLAGELILKSMLALRGAGYKMLYLVVTEGNLSAENLYRKLGFEFLGPTIPDRGVLKE